MNSTPNPYAPPTAPLSDKGSEADMRASRGSRLGARILDGLIVGAFIYIPLLTMGGGLANLQAAGASGRSGMLAVYSYFWNSGAAVPMMIGLLVMMGINLYLLYRSGQTMGKKLVGIHIARSDGSRAALSRILLIRILPFYVISIIPIVGSIVQLADPLFIFSESRKCLHDRLADTIVLTG
jgi:uncharacterized RDD family membrane protein YckC